MSEEEEEGGWRYHAHSIGLYYGDRASMYSARRRTDSSARDLARRREQRLARQRTEAAWNSAQVPDPDDLHVLALGHCDDRAPGPVDERLLDPELTLYREVTGRRAAGTTHAAWHAEYLATGLDLPKERMLALVTEQQHDDLLDGPAVVHSEPTDTRHARADRGEIMAAWTGWPRQALTAWQDLPGSWKGVLLFMAGYVLFIATIAALAIATA